MGKKLFLFHFFLTSLCDSFFTAALKHFDNIFPKRPICTTLLFSLIFAMLSTRIGSIFVTISLYKAVRVVVLRNSSRVMLNTKYNSEQSVAEGRLRNLVGKRKNV